MKVSIQNLLSLAGLALSLSACGNNTGTTYTNGSGQTCNTQTGVCTGVVTTGSASIANGVISFTLNNPSFNGALTAMVGGTIPPNAVSYSGGTYGQALVGSSAVTSSGYQIQYSQKQSVANGQFQIYGTSGSLAGTIQLGQIPMNAIASAYGTAATVTNIGVYIIQTPYGANQGSYAFVINEVHVYFYINGSATPIEVVF